MTTERKVRQGEDAFEGCEFCQGDAEQMLVSVSPRRFGPREGKTEMEIRNGNPFPIYFRTNTSSTNLGTHPRQGCIPPNGKASVAVTFRSSAVPPKRHEEVIVIASQKPFEDRPRHYDDRLHQEAGESVRNEHRYSFRETHHQAERGQKEGRRADDVDCSVTGKCEQCRRSEQAEVRDGDLKEAGTGHQHHIFRFDREDLGSRETRQHACQRCNNTHCRQNLQNEERRQGGQTKGPEQLPCLRPLTFSRHHESLQLEEICIHALVHRPGVDKSCPCSNCVSLPPGAKVDTLRQRIALDDSQRPSETRPNVVLGVQTKRSPVAGRGTEPHVLARVTTRPAAPASDSDLSDELWWSGPQTRRYREISEDDFNRKVMKRQEKMRKRVRVADDSPSETTPQRPVPSRVLVRSHRMASVSEKCSQLIQLSWVNLALLLTILLVIVGLHVVRGGPESGSKFFNCVFDYFL